MSMALFWTLGSLFFGYANGKLNRKNSSYNKFININFFLLLLAFININNFFLNYNNFSVYGFFGAFTLVILDHYRRLLKTK